MRYNLILIWVIVIMLSITSVSAFEFDNIKQYDTYTKTALIQNAFGLGSDIASIKLETPQIVKAPIGYSKVAEFTINSLDDYSNALQNVEFYNANGMTKRNQQFDFYVKTYETLQKEILGKDTCQILKNGTYSCQSNVIGYEDYQEVKWIPYEKMDVTKGQITIGIFTEVKENDYVEWIPELFGVKIPEWAIYSADPLLHSYYKLDNSTGTVAYDSVAPAQDLTVSNSWTPYGKINNALNITTGAAVSSGYTLSGTSNGWTINAWVYRNGSFVSGSASALFGVGASNPAADGSWRYTSGNCPDQTTQMGLDIHDGSSRQGIGVCFDYPLNQWIMTTIVLNSTNAFQYINGTLNKTYTLVTYTPSASTFIFFADGGSANVQKNTYVDEIGIWNRTLDQSEINQLYNNYVGFSYPFLTITAVNLTNPLNNTGYTDLTNKTFNATATLLSGSIVNATRYLYNSTGSLISTNFTNISNIFAGNKTNFTIPNLAEGSYLWNIQMCSSDGSCSFANNNFTFYLDSTLPRVSVTTPTNQSYIYPINQTNANFTLNLSATDTIGLGNCWFNSTFNSSITFMTCNSIRQVNLTNIFGRQTIYLYANDTANNVNMNQTTIIIPKINYNSTIGVFTTEGYSINQSYFNSLSASSVNLVWNGTTYGTSISIDGASNTVASEQINIPSLSGTIFFYFVSTLSNGTVLTSPTYNQTIQTFTIDNCLNGTTLILNFSNFDQDNRVRIPFSTYNVDVKIGDSDLSNYIQYSNNYTNASSAPVCLNINLTSQYRMDVITQWVANSSYFTQFYNIQNYTLANSTLNNTIRNISLYNLLQSSGQVFNILIKDSNYIPLQDALVQIDRQYVNLGTFLTAEIPKTDSLGSTVSHLILNNQLYNIYIKKNGQLIATFLNQQPYCNPLLTDCTITFNIAGTTTVPTNGIGSKNIFYIARYNDTTSTYYIDYSSVNGSTNTINITGYDNNGLAVCSNNIISSSGTLSCTIPASSSGETVTIRASSNNALVFTDNVQVGYSTRNTGLSYSRYLLAGLLLPAAVLMGAGSASISLVLFCMGLIICAFIFLIDTQSIIGAGSFIAWFIVAAVILIIKIARRPNNG